MAGREIKGGIVIHPIIATAILGAMITVSGWMYYSWSSSAAETRKELAWQHDQIVIIATQKDDAEKAAAAAREAARQDAQLQALWREKIDKQMARLELKNGITGGQ